MYSLCIRLRARNLLLKLENNSSTKEVQKIQNTNVIKNLLQLPTILLYIKYYLSLYLLLSALSLRHCTYQKLRNAFSPTFLLTSLGFNVVCVIYQSVSLLNTSDSNISLWPLRNVNTCAIHTLNVRSSLTLYRHCSFSDLNKYYSSETESISLQKTTYSDAHLVMTSLFMAKSNEWPLLD